MNPNSDNHFPFDQPPAVRRNGENASGNARIPLQSDDQTLESVFGRLSVSSRASPNPTPDFRGQIADRSGLLSIETSSGFTPRYLPPVNPGFLPPENSGSTYSMVDPGFPVSQNRSNGFDYAGLMGYTGYTPYSTQSDMNPYPLDSNRSSFNGFSNQYPSWLADFERIDIPRRTNNFDLRSRANYGWSNGYGYSAVRQPQRILDPQNNFTIEDFRGNIVFVAKDQYGCKLLHNLIENAPRETIDKIFMEVIGNVVELMMDSSANSVVSKLVEVITEEQGTQIVLMIAKNQYDFARICVNTFGTRVVQKLLEKLTTRQQRSIFMSALSPLVLKLTKETNGSHVIMHCFKNFPDEANKYLLNQIADHCFSIATDKSGCCVLQECVKCSNGETRARLVDEIIANAVQLSQDCYGNYVVQHLLTLKNPEITLKLVRQLEGSYTALSCDKFASNVVEKFMKELGLQTATLIITELLNSQNASMLLVDPYGNFVIQSALTVSSENLGELFNALITLILENAPMMRNNMFGKKVLEWFNKKLPPQEMRRQNGRRYQYQDFLQF